MTITVKLIYDNYPDVDLLPIEVTEETTFADIESMDIGDTLFLFLCRELADPDECDSYEVAINRCDRAIVDIEHVRDAILALRKFNENNAGGVAADQSSDQPSGSDAESS